MYMWPAVASYQCPFRTLCCITTISVYVSRRSSKMAADGRLVKMEVDYSETVDKKLPEVQEMAKAS